MYFWNPLLLVGICVVGVIHYLRPTINHEFISIQEIIPAVDRFSFTCFNYIYLSIFVEELWTIYEEPVSKSILLCTVITSKHAVCRYIWRNSVITGFWKTCELVGIKEGIPVRANLKLLRCPRWCASTVLVAPQHGSIRLIPHTNGST